MAPLPLSFYEQFLQALTEKSHLEIITYDDLPWGDDFDFRNSYPNEWSRWRAAERARRWERLRATLRERKWHPRKAYVLIQHDTDHAPEQTLTMADLETRFGVRSTIMTFSRWRKRAGELTEYRIDWQRLMELERRGFCVGYHCNALHNSGFDAELAYDYFQDELATLSGKFDINFFSAHGGSSGPNGELNCSLDYADRRPTRARWVHNRFTPQFTSNYSDGGLLKRLSRGDDTTDLRAWLHGMRPGRHRVIIHAQHYQDDRFEPLARDPKLRPAWYNEYIELVDSFGLSDASKMYWSQTGR